MLIPRSDAAQGGINILPTFEFQDTVSAIKPCLLPRKSSCLLLPLLKTA